MSLKAFFGSSLECVQQLFAVFRFIAEQKTLPDINLKEERKWKREMGRLCGSLFVDCEGFGTFVCF